MQRELRSAWALEQGGEGGGMEHSSGVVDILRNASNYGILSLLLMEAKATHLENERPGREQENEDLRLELLHCANVELLPAITATLAKIK